MHIVGYDIVYDVVGFPTMSYTTSYVYVRILRYRHTMFNAMSAYYDVEFFKRYDYTTS